MVREVYRLIDWFVQLPPELEEQLKNQIRAYEEERQMPYIPSYEREAHKEGVKEGRRDEMLELASRVLKTKFGEAGAAFGQELQTVVDLDRLRRIVDTIVLEPKSIDELRAMVR
jgi:hypothetical protein